MNEQRIQRLNVTETSGPPCQNISEACKVSTNHDDVIKWKHFPRYWPFVRGLHRSPVNSLHKGQWRGALMFSLICVSINGWVNNREAGDLRRYRAHYDVTVMHQYEAKPNSLIYKLKHSRSVKMEANSVRPSYATQCHRTSTLAHVMASCFSGTKPLCKSMQKYHPLDP